MNATAASTITITSPIGATKNEIPPSRTHLLLAGYVCYWHSWNAIQLGRYDNVSVFRERNGVMDAHTKFLQGMNAAVTGPGVKMSKTDTVVEITKSDSVMQKVFNKESAIAWINSGLFDRAHHDIRTSICLYDADKDFVMMLDELPDEAALQRVRVATRVRYWSKGIV